MAMIELIESTSLSWREISSIHSLRYMPNLNDKIIRSLRSKISDKSKLIADKEKSDLGKKIALSDKIRIVDLIEFTNQ